MILSMILSILFLFNILLILIQAKISEVESDHPYHLGLINGIRENNHRFIKSYPNIIGEKNFAYPQLFHWLLSFLPKLFLDKYYYLVGAVLNLFALSMLLSFSFWAYPILMPNLSIDYFVLYSGLLYIVTPFSWAIWNAKNTGVSVRGLGIILAYFYQYLILLYFFSGNWMILFTIVLIVFIILLSSQFAMQYILLTLPFYAVLYSNFLLIIIPPVTFLIFYILDKEVAISYAKGQFWHKKIYYKYLAKQFILKIRPSIWYDLVFDIWNRLLEDPKRGLIYAYHNSVVSIFIFIPALSFISFFFLYSLNLQLNEIETFLFSNIVISLIVFFITSFRKTRFLGEPERYVEFSIPNIILLTLSIFGNSISVIHLILLISIFLIFLQFLFTYLSNRYRSKNDIGVSINGKKIMKILNELKKRNRDLRVFSNNKELLKFALDTDSKVLITNLTSNYTGSFKFNEIYAGNFPIVQTSVIVPLIDEFKINCFILDTSEHRPSDIEKFKDLNLSKFLISENFTVYKVSENE
jgi:hypothetical protein